VTSGLVGGIMSEGKRTLVIKKPERVDTREIFYKSIKKKKKPFKPSDNPNKGGKK
jgi:hypothetical protein